MNRNFFEILVMEPNERSSSMNVETLKDLQLVADTLASKKGTIDCKFRKCIDDQHQERLLFAASWETIEDHDELDTQGVTPKLLKVLLAHLTLVSGVSAYFFFTDSDTVNFDAPVWTVNGYHVKEDLKAHFQKQLDTHTGIVGGWYVTKKLPPSPAIIPTDPVELKILEEGQKRAEARLKAPNPNIWISISTSGSGTEETRFREKVSSHVQYVQSGRYETLISGKKP